jgi:hypothetical protein
MKCYPEGTVKGDIRMRKTLTMCTVAVAVFAAGAIASPRAEAMTIGSPVDLSAAIHEANLAQDVAYYYPYAYYSPYGYYRYVCRGWWKACGWEPGHYGNWWPNRYSRPYR